MRLPILLIVATSCGGAAPATPAEPATAAAPAGNSIAKRFAAELDCSATSMDMLRGWCAVTQIETAGFTLPDKAVTLFGISVPIRPNAKIRDSLLGAGSRLNTLTMDAGHLQFRDIKPENDDERKQLLEVLFNLVATLNHKQSTLPVSAGLATFADAQRANAATGQAAHSDPHGLDFTAKAPSHAYLVNNVYVIVEDEADGTWVSAYPVADYLAH
jgi:hypothetical protein